MRPPSTSSCPARAGWHPYTAAHPPEPPVISTIHQQRTKWSRPNFFTHSMITFKTIMILYERQNFEAIVLGWDSTYNLTSSIRTVPPLESFSQIAVTSSRVSQFTKNDIAGGKVKYGPPFNAVDSCPSSWNVTVITDPFEPCPNSP